MDENKYDAPRKDNSKTFLILLIIILLGVIGYLLYNNSQKVTQIEAQDQRIESDSVSISGKVKELEEIKLAYERVKMDREAMGLSNDSLNKEMEKLNQYIVDVKRGNAKKIGNLNNMVEKFKADLAERDQQIVALTSQRDSLQTVTTTLSDTIKGLSSTKTALEEQVAIASILRAENIKVTVINSKGKELDKEEFRAKTIDKLKITLNIGENKVARKEKKNIYMRLIEPSGSALFDLATGGGFVVSDGKEIPYTAKETIDFDNSRQNITFVYVKGSPYKEGQYTIEIYHEGHKIGESRLTVK